MANTKSAEVKTIYQIKWERIGSIPIRRIEASLSSYGFPTITLKVVRKVDKPRFK